ncbi:MAG TPA: orotidine-5'-phosphate decarboxylase [Acidisarcina sp.]
MTRAYPVAPAPPDSAGAGEPGSSGSKHQGPKPQVSQQSPPRPSDRQASDALIVALDFPSATEALALIDRLEGSCRWFKVGLELYLAAGNSIISTLKDRGYSVFLDLKLHDIPNTVAGAVRVASTLGADLLTIHALGGPAMLAAALESANSMPHSPRLLAVTVLTSMDAMQLRSICIEESPANEAILLAKMAEESGITGLVASPEEVREMRTHLRTPLIVTPGIRPSGAAVGDQKRVATPAQAISDGADYLVVGRPITQAPDPAGAVQAILAEMGSTYRPL